MGPNEKLFKKEYAVELFRISENDLYTARVLFKSQGIRPETILFNIEQAVEKSLKAVLCHNNHPIPLTHDIYGILCKFTEVELPPGGYTLHDLTPFATVRRYEEGNYIIEDKDIEQALNLAEEVIEWARKNLCV